MEFLIENNDTVTLLAQLATGGLSVFVVKWFFERGIFGGLKSEQKMIVGAACTSLLGIGAALLLIFGGYNPMPENLDGWLFALSAAVFEAYSGSQALFVWLRHRNPKFSKPK